jgi:tRNA threonylcarbamoyladenosine biosynthesis protein TsaB
MEGRPARSIGLGKNPEYCHRWWPREPPLTTADAAIQRPAIGPVPRPAATLSNAMTPCLLALDTSTDRLAAALQTPAGRWCVNEAGGALASARLVPLLMQLLADAGVALAQVQAIAFGQGPGAFTGLRTACAVAQGLAFAGNTPVLAIDSLLIVAEDARAQAAAGGLATAGCWWVAMDARMDEVYAAAFHYNDPVSQGGQGGQLGGPDPAPDRHGDHGGDTSPAGWQLQVAPRLWTLPALVDAWAAAPPARVTGNALAVFVDRLPAPGASVWPQCVDRAAALLRLAEQAWRRGEGRAADQALPIYLRDKVAQTTAERQALRDATHATTATTTAAAAAANVAATASTAAIAAASPLAKPPGAPAALST